MKTDFFTQAIKSVCQNAYNIKPLPEQGNRSHILTARNPIDNQKYIFKFSHKETSKRSSKISQILLKYDINVPDIKSYTYQNVNFMSYPYICGETFHQKSYHMSDDDYNKVANDLAQIIKKIRAIPLTEFRDVESIDIHNKILFSDNYVNIFLKRAFFWLNNIGDKNPHHCDLHSKNILLNPDNSIKAIIDLEGVYISNYRFFMFNFYRTPEDRKLFGLIRDKKYELPETNLTYTHTLVGLKTLLKKIKRSISI